MARAYRLVIERDFALKAYLGRTIELPLVMADGATIEACAESVLEATTLAIAAMLEKGEAPPAPARSGKRDNQLNIRVSAQERLELEEAARREGFTTVADYVRTTALKRSA